MHICYALLKYGYSNFSLGIIEYCEPEKCLEREDFYLSSLKHEYNILEKAGSPLGRKHSELNITTNYNSFSEAARALNLPNFQAIANYILRNQKKPYKGIYTFFKKKL